MIRLHTLGAVELRRSDGSAETSVTSQPKRLALLVYMAAARPPGFRRRDTLVGLFWPGSPEEKARNALGQALSFLRRSLGSHVIVARGNDEVGVAPDALWCDAAAVHEALKSGRVDDALELYRGDLLPGFFLPGASGFEEWLDRERSYVRRAVLEAASSRAAELEGSDPRAAAHLLRRALGIAPEDEDVLRRLMALLDKSGDRAGALAVFDAFARRLAAELEVEPAPETLALRDRIASRAVSRRSTPAPATSAAAPLPPDAGPVRSAVRYRGWAAALILLATAGAAGLWFNAASQPKNGATAGLTLAVAPFTPATADTGLLRIARELVVPLTANLDGLGDVRAVEGVKVLAAAGPVEASDSALRLARRLGASRVLYGAIVSAGAGLRAEATLLRVADGHRILRATVSAERDVSALADSLTWAVLRELWTGRAASADSSRLSPPEPAPPALATGSLPALRAYWEGERATAQDRWADAARHFARAIELDSAYWFAFWRYGYARNTVEAPVDSNIRAAYQAHRFEFPERDRLLIEAGMADSLSERIARYRAVTRSFPGYWQGWWDFANRLVHDGPFLGSTHEDAREAIERALALRPNDVIALQHLFWMAAEVADVPTMERVVRRIHAVRESSPDFAPRQPDELELFELMLAAARGNPPVLAREIGRNIASLSAHVRGPMADRISLGPSAYGFHHAQIEMSRRFLESAAPPEIKAAQRRALALTWAARGAWDSAMVAAQRYAEAVEGPVPLQHMLRLAVAGEWLGGLPAGAADSWRRRLAPYEERLEPLHRAELAWLEGVLAAARGNPDSLAASRQRLRAIGGHEGKWDQPLVMPTAGPQLAIRVLPRALDASLQAFATALQGDIRGAAEAMARLERQRAEHGWAKGPSQWHPYLTAINRLAAARWMRESGRHDQVEWLLAWSEAVEFPAYLAAEATTVMDGPAYHARARAAETLDRGDQARRLYAQFRRRYDAPAQALRFLEPDPDRPPGKPHR